MLDLLGECVEKRKALLENQYNGEINKLKAIVHEIDDSAFISLQDVSDIIRKINN